MAGRRRRRDAGTSLGPLLSRLLATPQGLDNAETVQEWRTMLVSVGVPERYPGQITAAFSAFVDVLERSASCCTMTGRGRDGPGSHRPYGRPPRAQPGRRPVRRRPGAGGGADRPGNRCARGADRRGAVVLAAEVDLETWWQMALAWLAVQSDEEAALEALLVRLDGADDPPSCCSRSSTRRPRSWPGSCRRYAGWLWLPERVRPTCPGWPPSGSTSTAVSRGPGRDEALLVGGMVALGRLARSSPSMVTDARR